jgi:phosphoenolpyruvate-protein kinase (PTS system EI component)
MSALLNISIRVDKLPKEKFVQGKNGAVYYNATVSVNDDTNQWGQNVAVTDSQTKEEREAKAPKTYIGNGKVVWTDGNIERAEQQEQQASAPVQAESNDLPF